MTAAPPVSALPSAGAAPSAGTPGLAASACLTGRWERSLLRTACGSEDSATQVVWLQGPSLFVGLRLPAGGPAGGFAGVFTRSGRVFEWRHDIRLGSPEPSGAATLGWEGGLLAARGVDGAGTGYWRRPLVSAVPCWGVRLASRSGQRAVLVRVGADIGWACGPNAAEVSLARAHGDVATITRSSNPSRTGAQFYWSLTPATATVAVAGSDGVTRSRWRISHQEGQLSHREGRPV